MKPCIELNPKQRMTPLSFLIVTLTLCLPWVGCATDEPATSTETDASGQTAQAPEAQTPPEDKGFTPVTSRQPSAQLNGETISAPGAAFTLPSSWRSEPPSSSMRLAQAKVPGAGGDATLTAFYFGPGGGGGVDANLDRWIGQLELDAGTQPSRDSFEVGAYKVTWIEVHGTLKSGTMGGPATAQSDSTLLGAVIEGAQGPWFFKVTGPSATLSAERESFFAMLRSTRSP